MLREEKIDMPLEGILVENETAVLHILNLLDKIRDKYSPLEISSPLPRENPIVVELVGQLKNTEVREKTLEVLLDGVKKPSFGWYLSSDTSRWNIELLVLNVEDVRYDVVANPELGELRINREDVHTMFGLALKTNPDKKIMTYVENMYQAASVDLRKNLGRRLKTQRRK